MILVIIDNGNYCWWSSWRWKIYTLMIVLIIDDGNDWWSDIMKMEDINTNDHWRWKIYTLMIFLIIDDDGRFIHLWSFWSLMMEIIVNIVIIMKMEDIITNDPFDHWWSLVIIMMMEDIYTWSFWSLMMMEDLYTYDCFDHWWWKLL